ncbi:RNA-directed DNA polymerase (Reverse transcriptase) [Trifolium medium]|uniref:RNA-directed DNA polymerase (Reverse transcriptase) n=1 Tax=Trifolium medium TaxID=97028 RepID=A0A392M830_9FABA|nr:RNA-directed DNA polymerase (Reverse transcriptase) [Trifolium medium]
MEAKVEALESEMTEFFTTLTDVQNVVKENHANLIAMLEKCFGKSVQMEEGASVTVKGTPVMQNSPEKTVTKGTDSNTIRAETMTEFRHAVKKVELSYFNGEDPAGWISRAEIYFRVQETSPEVKVRLAQLCMEGSTIHFFNSLIGDDEEITSEKLKEALLGRYGGHGEGDVYEQLTELKQNGSVDDYITEFEYLTAQIPKLPEKQFLGYFLHGLKVEIRGKVRSLAAMGEMNRTKLLQVTRAVEKEIKGSGSNFYRGSKHGNGSFRSNSHRSGKSGTDWVMVKGRETESGGGAKNNSSGPRNERPAQSERRRSGARDRGFTHLSYQELMDRKQKGLCFKCGGPFHPMHQCPDKQLSVLVLDEDDRGETEENMIGDDGGETEENVIAVEVDESDEEKQGEMCILNLNHISYGNNKTVKFQGEMCGVPVLVLVDSGATHNFISQKLVRKLELPVEETPVMSIKLGHGFKTSTQGVCKGMELCIGDFKLTPAMHLFELGGIDVVLGIEWLSTLGDMIVNWQQQTMSFWRNKKWVTLQGIDGGGKGVVALQSILSKPKLNNQEVLWGMKGEEMGQMQELTSGQQKELQSLLHKYERVFQEPSGLPPKRNKEHAINLINNHGAVNASSDIVQALSPALLFW